MANPNPKPPPISPGRGHNKIAPNHVIFCQAYAETGNASHSARAAGYPEKTAPWTGRQLLQHAKIQAEIQRVRDEARKACVYDAVKAMDEAKEAMKFAKETDNANAYVKAVELRSKLSGLLIDKIQAQVGSFTIAIEGIDDRPRLPPSPVQIVSAEFALLSPPTSQNQAEEEEEEILTDADITALTGNEPSLTEVDSVADSPTAELDVIVSDDDLSLLVGD